MNIAFYFTFEINPILGGTERVTYALAENFKLKGFNCIYISFKKRNINSTLSNNDQYYLPNSQKLICVENIDFVQRIVKDKNINFLINQDSFDLGNEFCSKKYFPNIKCITVIHYNLFGSCIYLEDALREQYILRKSNFIKYQIQRFLCRYYKKRAIENRAKMLKKVYQNSDYVIVLSDDDKNQYPVQDKSRICVIPNPITLSCSNVRMPKEKRVLYVGRMVYSPKRVDYLLKAWSLIEKKHPDWTLDLLGDGTCLDYYKLLAQKLCLKNIIFHGSQVPTDYYKRASILCMTSTYEGFGLVLTEAMNFGTIPIAFDSFSVAKEIIDNGINGFLVKSFNIHEYADAIELLMVNDNLRRRMSISVQKKVQKYKIDEVSIEWAIFLNRIFNES